MKLFGYTITREDRGQSTSVATVPDKPESRSSVGPFTDMKSFFAQLLAGGQTKSGISVTPESAMTIAAVHAAVRVLAESIASLPLKVYERDGTSRHPVSDHVASGILNRKGNSILSAMKVREMWMVHASLWGNSLSEIERDNSGRPIGIWPIDPTRIQRIRVVKADNRPELRFDIRVNSETRELHPSNVLFIPGLGDGLIGKSPITLHREMLGASIASEQYGAAFFKNGSPPGVVFEHPLTLGTEAVAKIVASWNQSHQGIDNAHKVAVLEEGMTIKTIGLPPADAQYIETRKFSRSEIAAIFRVPPHMIGDLEHATYSNIEFQGIEFVVHTLRPWLVRIEQAITNQLLTPKEQETMFVSHVVDGLLRGDIKSRYEAYAMAKNGGWFNADDIRELENMNPLPDGKGKIYLQPLNMVEAGTDPLAASNDDVDFSGDGARFAHQRVQLSGGTRTDQAERRALPPRYKTGKALETVYRDQMKRVVKRELSEIRKQLKMFEAGSVDIEEFRTWLKSFERENAEWMESRVLAMFVAMGEAMLSAATAELDQEIEADSIDTFVNDYSRAFTRRHSGSSRGQLEALLDEDDPLAAVTGRLDEWEETRATKEARRERQRSSNAFTYASWAVAGVATVTVVNVGARSCPICEELDGRTAVMGSTILNPGDNVAGLEVKSNVKHPPFHGGCDCIMVPGPSGRNRLAPAELRDIFSQLLQHASIEDYTERSHVRIS